MKKIVLTLLAAMILGWQGMSFAATSVDALIQKLEDKGILTNQEASQIKDQISGDESDAMQKSFKSQIPDWVSGLKVSGDFRIRDQVNRRDVPNGTSAGDNLVQNRARIRARLNFEDQVNDKLKMVVGIATGGGTARSNNYTLGGASANKDGVTNQDSFGKPEIILNKAYAVYTPNDMITVMGGKLDNPVWEPANASFFWDPDITPEGGAIQIQKKLNDYVTPWVQEVVFDLHNQTPTAVNGSTISVKTDPYMMLTQGGLKGNLTEKVYYKAAVSWYDINNPSHLVYGESVNTNSQVWNPLGYSVLKYNFNDVIVEGADIGINDPFGDMLPTPIYIPQVGVFGDFASNQASGDKQNKAWEAGAYMGSSALNGWGTWKIQSYYKVLERDSWLDILPDDDFYSGDTNTKGWRSEIDIGLAKNVWFTMSYFHTNVFKDLTNLGAATASATNGPVSATMSKSAPEDLFQMDLNMKF
jgi:hypothetical protein